jgi:hypothetical protein
VANNNKRVRAAAKPEPVPVSRIQRSLLYMAGSVLGLGIAALIATLIFEATITSQTTLTPVWAVVAVVPDIAIPLGFALFIALIVTTYVQRSRTVKGAGK